MMLRYDPRRRITAKDATQHPYFGDIHYLEGAWRCCQRRTALSFARHQHHASLLNVLLHARRLFMLLASMAVCRAVQHVMDVDMALYVLAYCE